jgi:hypothetical protein
VATRLPKTTKPAPKAEKSSGTAFTIRGSAAWRKWIERGCEHCRTDASKLFDVAVIAYLKSQGFTEAPPKR